MGRVVSWLAMVSALVVSVPASADSYAFPIDIRSGLLANSLRDLARQTGIELLFDRDLVGQRRSPGVEGRLAPEAALLRLLSGTGLSARRSASGAWLVEPLQASRAASLQDLAVPEILVIGRRTQDADIRRRENDIQPYQVATREQIVGAHRDNLDQYFQSRITANAMAVPPSLGNEGNTNSQIDLRGLGADQTLILVDGRRMPSIPERSSIAFGQSDVNAIPLHAIERVETLTGTAGGIYGFGALGGVVNVVLRRDLRGLELHATSGISSRGDARRLSLEGGFGFTPDQGNTDVMVYFGRSWQQPLLNGQRGYMLRGREKMRTFTGDQFFDYATLLEGNGINVFAGTLLGPDLGLILKPQYGGQSLGSRRTFLPAGYAGGSANLAATLIGNAGQIDITPSQNDDASYLDSNPTTTSAMFNVRHRFGSGIEAYFDALYLRNHGKFIERQSDGLMTLDPESPLNPFENYIAITFPNPAQLKQDEAIYTSQRYTGGIIVPLGDSWKATAEAIFASLRYTIRTRSLDYYLGPFFLDGTESPPVIPFGNWGQFQQQLSAYLMDLIEPTSIRWNSRYRGQSLRAAGPLFRIADRPATLSLLAERRTETLPRVTGKTRSAYAELHAPLIDRDARFPILRGLEVQLAARHDLLKARFDPDDFATQIVKSRRARFSATTLTAGAKFFPLSWVMLRASYATGRQAPPLEQLVDETVTFDRDGLRDLSGSIDLDDTGQYTVKYGGSPDLRAIRARTIALGMVLNPAGGRAPRISIDYSHVRRSNDYVVLDSTTILQYEDLWPERVVREPLTDADRAKGYTLGLISTIDSRAINGARLDVESIDGRLDWTLPFAGGMLRLNGAATLQLRTEKRSFFGTVEIRVGYRNGPLRWRANGGAEWTRGRSTIGANLQYYGAYNISSYDSISPGYLDLQQGSDHVRAQAYLDLFASRRIPIRWGGRDREMSVDLGIVNVLDRAPPYQADLSLGSAMYSPYGDPRRRRFELTLNASF